MKKEIEKMKNDLNKYLDKYENSFPKIKGVGNISRGDIEECILILETMEQDPYRKFAVYGSVEELFNAYKVEVPKYNRMAIFG